MLKHTDIWSAIDRLAARYGLSASGLARRAGLDPTTFNKSKRLSREGKQRWPSTESISKILDATGASLAEFVCEIGESDHGNLARRMPVIGYTQACGEGYFDEAGHPSGTGWEEVSFPQMGDPQSYALKISGDSLEPVYRDGETIIVSPDAPVRRGDRVVVRTTNGKVIVKELLRRNASEVELVSIGRDKSNSTLQTREISWIARIVWASQ